MMSKLFTTIKRHPVLVSFAVGVCLLIFFVAVQKTPERSEVENQYSTVRTIHIKKYPLTLTATGYGIAQATETWRAIANVGGHIIAKHPNLESGAIVQKGSLLLQLDPSRFELSIADATAEISSVSTELNKLKVEQQNTQRLLEIENQRWELSNKELERIESLFKSGSVSQSVLDQQRRLALAQQQSVANLENTLALIPTQVQVLEAKRKRAQVKLEQAERDLVDTRFYAPYDLRINQSEIELHHFISPGQLLFTADNITSSDIEARFPFQEIQRVVTSAVKQTGVLENLSDVDLSSIAVEVDLVGAESVTWHAKLIRIANGLEPNTRTVRAIIQVQYPYKDIDLPNRPALQPNMYTRVKLTVPLQNPVIVIPANSVVRDHVFVVDSQSKIEQRPVNVSFYQGDLAIIQAGLTEGDLLVVDDIPFMINGRVVQTQRDEKIEQQLLRLSSGESL